MANSILEEYRKMFNVELPQSDSMDGYLDFILSQVGSLSEDLSEDGLWQNKRWKEIKDRADFHEDVLHIFRPDGTYMIVIDGNISKGAWSGLESPRSVILQHGSRHELYDLAFLDNTFLILRKHGDQRRKGQPKYFVLGQENKVRNLEWRDAMELLFNLYRENSRWTTYWIAVVFILLSILALSFL